MTELEANRASRQPFSTGEWLSSNERTAEAIEVILSAAGQGKSMKRVLRRMAASAPHHFSVTVVVAWETWEEPLDLSAVATSAYDTWFFGNATRVTLLDQMESLTEPCILMTRNAIAMYEASPDPRVGLYRLLALQRKLSQTFDDLSRAISGVIYEKLPQHVELSYTYVDWIAKSNTLYRTERKEEALDLIFDSIDDMLLAEKFRECDDALSRILIEDLSNSQLLTVLTATLPAKSRLPRRGTFFSRAKAVLDRRGAHASRLLAGLE